MSASIKGWVIALALTASAALPMPSQAASLLEKTFYLFGPRYDSILPQCEAALGTIASRFATKESRFWNSSLQITDFADIRETALRPWNDQTIPRRFCTGKARVDGKWHTVRFAIIEDAGIIGLTWDVDWCVVGYDRNWAYNPQCAMAGP
jgi:hypothetical protein